MFAKETYTTRRNSLKNVGIGFLLFGITRRVATMRIILIISAKVLLLFILGLALCRIGDMDIILYGWDPACLV